MKKILLINTGGTFNKRYNPLTGTLEVIQDGSIIEDWMKKWLCEFKLMNIIGKDSLDMTTEDRMELLAMINMSSYEDIIVIHGTDTMHVTAEYLEDAELEKRIVLTGAMVPYTIDSAEASANLASAVTYLQFLSQEGIYIVMNGVMGNYKAIRKDRRQGKFVHKL